VHYWDATVRYGFFLIFSFTMSRLKRALDEEKQLSRTDTVTKIANGRLFLEMTDAELQKLRRYNHAFTVAYMDLDNFKEVNDRFGHNAGDELLRLVAETLRKNIRSADVVARLGGDEFGVLFPETDNGPAHVVVNKLLRGLKAAARESACPVTFSIGVMTFKNAPASLNEVIKLADDIMYSVKSSGKNNVRFETWSIKEKAGIP
jgi:diguanylate cyclase (GGDEF)-like protein